MGVDGGSKVRWMLPFPAMDDVDGKGDGIATGPALYKANDSKAWTKGPSFGQIEDAAKRAMGYLTPGNTIELAWDFLVSKPVKRSLRSHRLLMSCKR